MRRRLVLLSFAVLGIAPTLAFAAASLVSGPMLGYQAHREVLIWLETRDAAEVSLTYQLVPDAGDSAAPAGSSASSAPVTLTHRAPAATPVGTQPQKFVLPLLEMGRRYTYSISVDGKPLSFPYPLTFRTTDQWEWRKAPPEFSFLFGSCAYLNDPAYDRPGTPYGKGTEIFRHMADSGADFCLWGGDNLYLREADYSSRSGIWYRYSRDRATPDMQKLWASMHHYATWDDHDYGPDNANASFEFKDVTLEAFKTYWGNPSYGEPDNPGVYGKFTWGDAIFLLMDDRYHRDDTTLDQDKNPRKTAWGERQTTWLKQSLLHAKALRNYRFKFIVTGGQVIQTAIKTTRVETHEVYRREREELIGFIRDNNISGVVFLTGDVHHTALYRRPVDDAGARFVYELTSSPLSSGSWAAAESETAKDPCVVPGTVVGTQNYSVVRVTGPKEARALVVRCYDKTNALQWEERIPAAALEPAPARTATPAPGLPPPQSAAPASATAHPARP